MSQLRNLPHLFFNAVDRFSSKRAALRYKAAGAWHDIIHHELARQVTHAAVGLRVLGLKPGDRVGILSANRPEWAISDYGSLLAGCVNVPVYPTLPTSQVGYILADAGARVVLVENAEQLDKVAVARHDLPALEHIILLDGAANNPGVMSFSQLLQHGEAAESHHPNLREEIASIEPDDLATLIYTSGTTGPPKGVMLTHGNFCSNVEACSASLSLGPDDSCLSFLPLSHSFERTSGHYVMFHAGATINYAENMDAVAQNLLETRPTVVISVPRLYEKMYGRVLDQASSGGALKRRLFFWARRTAERWAKRSLAGLPIPSTLSLAKLVADRLVFARLKQRTGGRLKYFISGGAPLAPDIATFFYAAGLPILEGYGLTETAPVVSVNRIDAVRIGTVGPPIPGVEVRIADDGEILVRGPNVMKGYYGRPDATAEVLDEAGWFHTGDVGQIDADGFLKITDRKKDLIVTAGGKNIAPQPIENLAKGSKFVLNAVMLGDRRRFPIMLVVPDIDALRRWATDRHLPVDDGSDFLQQPDVTAKVEREVRLHLRDLASFEMPKKILLVDRAFTVEGGELTPTLKVKRRVVEERYRDLIDEAYRA